jgi:hypothetical protein
MKQTDEMYRYYLAISIIRLGEDGKALINPPCEIEPQILVNLNNYINTVTQAHLPVDERTYNNQAYESATEGILITIYHAQQCPLGWKVCDDNWLEIPNGKAHNQSVFSPKDDMTEINFEFVYQHAIKRLQSGDRGLHDKEFFEFYGMSRNGIPVSPEDIEEQMYNVPDFHDSAVDIPVDVDFLRRQGIPIIVVDENTTDEDFKRQLDDIPFPEDLEPPDEERESETLDVYDTPESIEDLPDEFSEHFNKP